MGEKVESEFRVPRELMSENGIEHDEQFAHAGGKRDLGFLAGRQQACVKRLHHRIAACRYQGRHVEHRPNLGTTAPNRPCTTELAAVVVERCDAEQCCNLAAGERA